MTLRDLFQASPEEAIDLKLRYSNARIAEQAQLAFEFNRNVDVHKLKAALVEVLRGTADDNELDYDEKDLRRAVDLAVMRQPDALKERSRSRRAARSGLSPTSRCRSITLGQRSVIVEQVCIWRVPGAHEPRGAQFRRAARSRRKRHHQMVDAQPGKRALGNADNPTKCQALFPDFVVGVAGRSTPDQIALVEIKDDVETGRLQSDRNLEKIRVQHREYRNVTWTFREGGIWVRARYSPGTNRIVEDDRFQPEPMVFLQ